MKRIHEGKYIDTRNVKIDGKMVQAEIIVSRVRIRDEKDSKKTLDTPFWSWSIPKLGIYFHEVFETKADAIQDIDNSLAIGFKTIPTKSVMLDLIPKSAD